MNRGKNKNQNQKAGNSMTYLDCKINIKYVLLFSRRDDRAAPEEKTLAQCLDSLLSLQYPAEKMEILLAIGKCTDNTRAIAEEYAKNHPQIRILENPTGNTSIGRNICITHATGSMLMNYSGHVIAEKNLLHELAVRLQGEPADVAAVGCSNLSPGRQNFVGEVSGAAFLSFMGGRNFF